MIRGLGLVVGIFSFLVYYGIVVSCCAYEYILQFLHIACENC